MRPLVAHARARILPHRAGPVRRPPPGQAQEHPVKVPSSLTRHVLLRHGESGRAWLEQLPDAVAAAAAAFDVRVGEAFDPGGTTAVSLAAGEDRVLKVFVDPDHAAAQAAALRRWDGEGAVRVLGEIAGALLLERCAPGTWL